MDEDTEMKEDDINNNLAPRMRTGVPGPRSVQLKKELNSMQEMSSVSFFADYDKSYGGARVQHFPDLLKMSLCCCLGCNFVLIVTL